MRGVWRLKRVLRRLSPSGFLHKLKGPDCEELAKEWEAMGRPLMSPAIALKNWEEAGRPAPPPHVVKQEAIRSHARQYDLRVFIETGTYYGDMVEAMKDSFEHVYSIELSRKLYKQARRRFSDCAHVHIVRGDSGVQLDKILKGIDQPAVFWLDGHYSGGSTARGREDTPVCKELDLILGDKIDRHVILIDDVRCFGSIPGYPTIEELKAFVLARRPDRSIRIQDDIMRITSPANKSATEAGS